MARRGGADAAAYAKSAPQAWGLAEAPTDAYCGLFDTNSIPTWVVDAKSLKILSVNRVGAELQGRARDEVIGTSVLDLCPPGDLAALEAALHADPAPLTSSWRWRQLEDDGKAVYFDLSISRARFDRRPVWVVSAAPERESTSEPCWPPEGDVGALAKLRFEQSPVGELLAHPDGRLLLANQALCQILGRAQDELASVLPASIVHPDDHGHVARALRDVRAGTMEQVTLMCRVLRPDGSSVPVRATIGAVRDAQGNRCCLAGALRDLSEADPAHRIGAEVLAAATEGSSDAVVLLDAAGLIIYASPAFHRLFGHVSKIGERSTELIHPSDLPEVQRLLGRLLTTPGLNLRHRWRMRPWGETWRLVEGVGSNLLDNPVVGVVVINIRDATPDGDQLAPAQPAHTDALTGLPNRFGLLAHLGHAPGDAKPLALFLLGLDRFRRVNEDRGQATGDTVLEEVGKRLRKATRAADMLARVSGDEFAVVVEGIGSERDALAYGRRLLRALRAPLRFDDVEVFVSASVGVALGDPASPCPVGLLAHANVAMEGAKDRGGAQVQVFREGRRDRRDVCSHLEGDLRRALRRDELAPVFQPIVSLASGQPKGAEALLRWEHPSAGLVLPSDFIPLAEETGLIVAIGDWVIEEAASQLAASHRAGLSRLWLTVNASARQFADESFAARAVRAWEEQGVDATFLCLEITESAVLHNLEATRATLASLKDRGVRIALDDFGTGYSTLEHLRHLPVDMVKIDQSFVANLGHRSNDVPIIEAVLSMASAMGLETVAEGVEEPEQAEILAAMGCSLAQGYHFGRPMAREDLVSWCVAMDMPGRSGRLGTESRKRLQSALPRR